MKKTIFSLLLSFLSLAIWAAESDSSVVFKSSFLKHEMQTYEISRTLYNVQKGDTTFLEKVRFMADVYVEDSTENYFLLTWKFSKFSINTSNMKLRMLLSLAKPVEVSYRISKPGVLMEFLNGENVSKCLEDALPKVIAQFADKKGKQMEAEVAGIYDMREALETLMLRSITQFHQAYGLGYKLDEVVDVPAVLPARFSSKPIQAVVRKKLTRIDAENNVAVLSTATFFNQSEFRKTMKSYLKTDTISDDSMEQKNMGSIVLDLSTGWVLWSFDQHESVLGKDVFGELVELNYRQPTN